MSIDDSLCLMAVAMMLQLVLWWRHSRVLLVIARHIVELERADWQEEYEETAKEGGSERNGNRNS